MCRFIGRLNPAKRQKASRNLVDQHPKTRMDLCSRLIFLIVYIDFNHITFAIFETVSVLALGTFLRL